MWPFARPALPPPPKAAEVPPTAARIGARLASLRARMVERLRRVNNTTETETLAAGAALHRLVELGRTHVAAMREVLETKVAGDGAQLTRAVAAQGERIRTDLDHVSASLEVHCAEVAAAAASAEQIRAAASAIAHLTGQARTLALNARIEAARAGDRGFSVIAEEMKRLSDAIGAANTTIDQLSKTLGGTLPAT